MKLGAVILAAGFSSRMGSFKPLMQLGGHSFLARCVHLFKTADVARIVVVSGHRGKEIATEAEGLGILVRANPEFVQGMFSSVCAAMPDMVGLDGFFMLPVDIPLIRPATLELLINAFDGREVIYPSRNGLRGHPPLIPGHLIEAIQEYNGNGGLKKLLEQFPGREIPVWDDGILLDGDNPEDFTQLVDRRARLAIGSRAEAETLAALLMPERGVAHGRAVAAIACTLAEKLNRHGYRLDLDLLYNGALLHDVAKGESRHEARGGEMMRSLGLDALAGLVSGHRDASLPQTGRIGERELVCLADKLVRGTKRMPVQQRFEEKLALYAGDQEACRAIQSRKEKALALQQAVEDATSCSLAEILVGEGLQ